MNELQINWRQYIRKLEIVVEYYHANYWQCAGYGDGDFFEEKPKKTLKECGIRRLKNFPNLEELTILANHCRPRRWRSSWVLPLEVELGEETDTPWSNYTFITPDRMSYVVQTVRVEYSYREGGHRERPRHPPPRGQRFVPPTKGRRIRPNTYIGR